MGARSHASQATEQPGEDTWAGQAPPGDHPGGGGGKVRAGSGCEDPMGKPPGDRGPLTRGSRHAERPRSQRSRGKQRQRDRQREAETRGARARERSRAGVGAGGRQGAGPALASVVPRPLGTAVPTTPVPEALSLARNHPSSWEGSGFILTKGPGSRWKVKLQKLSALR